MLHATSARAKQSGGGGSPKMGSSCWGGWARLECMVHLTTLLTLQARPSTKVIWGAGTCLTLSGSVIYLHSATQR
jgi:hypothetical protein